MDPIPSSGRRKQRDRRAGPRRADDGAARPDRRAEGGAPASESRALVPVAPTRMHDAATPADKAPSSAAFAAQLLGQPGAKRGLKGGAPVLEGARAAYLESEFLGKGERRTPKGVIAKTEI
jgi:hypothetical protein